VSIFDSTAATIEGLARKATRQGVFLFVSGATPAIRRVLLAHGVQPPLVRFEPNLTDALAAAHAITGTSSETAPQPAPRWDSEKFLQHVDRAFPADALEVVGDPAVGGLVSQPVQMVQE